MLGKYYQYVNKNITAAIVFGTRPEFIKLKQLILLVRNSPLSGKTIVVNTGQHQELLNEQLALSGIKIDEDLQIEREHRELSYLAGHCLIAFTSLIKKYPNLQFLIGQGDTNTVLCLSMFCYLENLKFIHIEAGLRTNNLQDPFPEEFNRRIGGLTSYFNFSPSIDARENLLKEGIDPSKIMVCGNTGIDALFNRLDNPRKASKAGSSGSAIVTIHRRERDESKVIQLAGKLNQLVTEKLLSNVTWVLHPNYSAELKKELMTCFQIHYVSPLKFNQFIELYETADLVITDSGGVTEEALTIGIPTIIFRNRSERVIPQDVKDRVLVSTNMNRIERFIGHEHDVGRKGTNYFGDGRASQKILDWLEKEITA